jgi:hypothetical protein
MERYYYDATSLERLLAGFETRYGIPSAEFYERHVADDVPGGMSGVHRNAWASFYRDVLRLRGEFVANAENLLALA